MPKHYIGLISGTSMDGVDAVIASFGSDGLKISATLVHSYPPELRSLLQAAIAQPANCGLDQLGRLDRWVGECFRDAALAVMESAGIRAEDVDAIGSHGQTLRHRPEGKHPFSLQIGDAATIAAGTGATTVCDFRRADIAAGGQGAPLVPPFHDWLFGAAGSPRVVLNLGGIANITVLPGDDTAIIGFDTGPGNTLMDAWIEANRGLPFDEGGAWAAGGNVIEGLLKALLADAYFDLPAPKSTGFEHFNLDWLRSFGLNDEAPADVQATLSELTAMSVAAAIDRSAAATSDIFVCGGGAHNTDLLRRLGARLPGKTISSTADVGLDPDWVEAAAFAWLAMRTMQRETGNLPSVTGADHKKVLGAIHYA
ncbi:MAG: anhydro-N-acetylmuramic acid kinase [Woeseiaceae bacterium]